MHGAILSLTLASLLGASPVFLAAVGLPAQTKKPPVVISVAGPEKNGARQIMRGEELSILGGPFNKSANGNKVKLTRRPDHRRGRGSKPSTSGLSVPRRVKAKEFHAAGKKARLSQVIKFRLPIDTTNGRHTLQVEVQGMGLSNAVAVDVIDPPIRILSHSANASFGGTSILKVNYAPAGTTAIVQRMKKAPFPEEWWSRYKNIGAPTFLSKPEITDVDSAWGTYKGLSVQLPESLGAGNFRVWVVAKGVTPSVFKAFRIDLPRAKTVLYTVRFDGLKCLEETDEVGPDEPYTVFMPGFFGGRAQGTRGHVHGDVDEGRVSSGLRYRDGAARNPRG